MTSNDRFRDENVRMDLLRERASNMRWAQQPEDVLCLTAADSDFPVAPAITEALTEYVHGGVLSYGPAEGLPSFRRAVAKMLVERGGVATHEDLIIAADSAASAMFVVARFALNPGDEAIIFDPVDFLFKSSTEAAGGTAMLSSIDRQTGRLDIDGIRKLVGPRTRMLGVCNPHNPLGLVFSREELRALGEIAVEHDLWIMNDEIWSDIVFQPTKFTSIASLSPEIAGRTITVSGLSKNFGLSGLRIGYIAAPSAEVRERLLEVSAARTTAWGASTLSQVAAQAAYERGWPYFESFLQHLTKVRDHAVASLNAMPGVRCRALAGTYLLFPDVSAYGMSSVEMAQYLLDEARVAIVPGAARWFGPGAEGHIRIAFPTSMGIVSEALDRIEAALRKRPLPASKEVAFCAGS